MTAAPPRFFDRELSWLDFNERVLSVALDPALPPLERLKFCAIHASNQNDFFMVRVAGLERRHENGDAAVNRAGLRPIEVLQAIRTRTLEQERQLRRALRRSILPALGRADVCVRRVAELEDASMAEATDAFFHEVLHQLTPTPFGPGWVYPGIPTLAFGIVARLRDQGGGRESLAFVRVPASVPRFVPLSDGRTFVAIEDLVGAHLTEVFPEATVLESTPMRIVRDADIEFDNEAPDVRQVVGSELRLRRHGPIVRLDVGEAASSFLVRQVRTVLAADARHVYRLQEPLGLDHLMQLATLPGHDALRVGEVTPEPHPRLGAGTDDIFTEIRRGDVFVHHPYHSYADTVERFVEQAVADPAVLAIKQTVYRTSGDSRIVPSLIAARNRERRAVCLVEIKARFDEVANLHWGRELEAAGVQVSYGLPGLKTHAKAVLVVRNEADGIRRYAHVGTGNYHARTARLYCDSGLFTCDEAITNDIAGLMHWLTDGTPEPEFEALVVAPREMRDYLISVIGKVAEAAARGERARIMVKVNSLVDPQVIDALYAASQAGARVLLNVRGICCLRPGVRGLSTRIRVVSIVGRVLEHSRLFAFQHGDEETVLLGSADVMQRNLDTRVETLVPVRDGSLRRAITRMLGRYMAERGSAWQLGPDGTWTPRARPDVEEPDLHEDLARLLSASLRSRRRPAQRASA